jgi:hypothetical protein
MIRRPLAPGDRVQYATRWLRSIGAYTGDLPFARGTVAAVEDHGHGFVLVRVDWTRGAGSPRVLAANLEVIR